MGNVINHFEKIAPIYDSYKKKNRYYYRSLKNLIRKLIPPGKSVLEAGCGTGEMLAEARPSKGVGIDISPKMIEIARKKYPGKKLKFQTADIGSFSIKKHFDYIVMVDVIEHLSDVDASLKSIAGLMDSGTVFINIMINPKWERIFLLAEKLGLKMPEGPHKRSSFAEIEAILKREGLSVYEHGFTTLMPIYIPALTGLINSYFEPIFRNYSCIEYFCARKNNRTVS